MIKHDFLKIWDKLQIWEALKAKNLNANFFYRKCFIFDPLKRNRKPFFNIMSGLSHRPDQIYHLWKFILGGPEINLRSIFYGKAKFCNLCFYMGKCDDDGFFGKYCIL